MAERSAFQRFTGELRRRHVPQTAAVYLVMAWAAIEFADVIVPNLDGPAWVVTAVIVAAGVGLPAVLVLAWIFDWGPEGIHRTPDVPADGSLDGSPGGAATAPSFSAPWMMAVAVLVVGIASALAVAALVSGNGGEPEPADEVVGEGEDRDARDERRFPDLLVPPDFAENPDSFRRLLRDGEYGLGIEGLEELGVLRDLDTMDMRELVDLARRVADEAGINLLIQEPREWRHGRGLPAPLAVGDTLVIQGVARDTAGVVSVDVDGTTVARSEDPEAVLRFTGRVIGTGALGTRRVTIRIATADGREIIREHEILQRPSGAP